MDKWRTNTSATRSNGRHARETASARRTRPMPGDLVPLRVEFLYDNGKIVRVDINYTDGSQKSLSGKAVDSDIIKGLLHIRSTVRLWANPRLRNSNGDVEYIDDDRMEMMAKSINPSGKLEDVAKALGYSSGLFLADDNGYPAVDERGEIIPATSADVGHSEETET